MRDETPVLIGAGQFTYRGEAAVSPSPLTMIKIAAERAAQDAGLGVETLAGLDGLAVAAFAIDAAGNQGRFPVPRLRNPPASLARRLEASPRYMSYSHMGGNTPQQLVNMLCERIARGENDFVLAVGAEFLGSLTKRLKTGAGFDDFETEDELGDPDGSATRAPASARWRRCMASAPRSPPIPCSKPPCAPEMGAALPTTRRGSAR